MEYVTANELLKSIRAFNVAAEGDSNDDEHDASVEMRDTALDFLRAIAARVVGLADMLNEYDKEEEQEEEITEG